jgi:thiosulfate reductase/polysulfide reductase chain A
MVKKESISRRRFMKIGLSCMAGAAMSVGSQHALTQEEKMIGVSRTSLKRLLAIPTTCDQCPAGCGIIAYLNGDRIVQILGNPAHPNNQGGICVQGLAGINLVEDPERILYPLKRIGPRGSNRWTRITWDEAHLSLASRLRALINTKRMTECVVDMGQSDALLDRFIHAAGIVNVIHRPSLKNLNQSSALEAMTGTPSLIPDVIRSRFTLNFGSNPYAHHDHYVSMARRLVDARLEKGAKLVTFDVRMSETAAKSDEWHPIRSGTDGGLALAMAHVIVDKDLADTSFIKNKTNTSLAIMRIHLSKYTPEWGEKECGIKAKDIERLAITFATQKPSVAFIGGGATDHENGSQNTRCISLLNWLVGNLEKEGGLFFPRLPGSQKSTAKSWIEHHTGYKSSIRSISELKSTNKSVDTYFAYLANPAYSDLDCGESARLLKDETTVPFLVVLETHMTETAMLADLVLPAATYLEGWGVSIPPSLDAVPVINLRQPAVSLLSPAKTLRDPNFDVGKLLESMFQPKGEAKEVGNFCLELAKKIDANIHKGLPFENTQEYVKETISTLFDQEVDFQSLREKGLWINPIQHMPSRAERLEISDENLRKKGQALLPDYQSIPVHREIKTDEFVLTPFKSNVGTKGTENSKWAREILHENRLWMNKDKASELGIKNGDKVRMTSSLGSINVRVLTTHRIHPDSVALAEGLGHTAFGNIAKARKFRSKDRDTQLIWWGKKGKGVNPNQIIKERIDPVGGGLASKDTVVQVHKIEE